MSGYRSNGNLELETWNLKPETRNLKPKTNLYLYLIFIYSILILTIHVIPGDAGTGVALNQTEIASFRADYILHMVAFVPWMVLVWLYLGTKNLSGNRLLLNVSIWLCAGVFLAVFAEGIQYWLPYRSFNPMDVVFNVAGVLLGGVVFVLKPARRGFLLVSSRK